MLRRFAKGFSLIELMIVVAIIAILASLAYYNYGRYAFRTRRADGREMLMRVAAAQERYFTNFNAYAPSITDAAPDGLGFTSATSERTYYLVTVTLTGGATGYVLAAAPQNGQDDDACGNLVIDNLGNKTPVTSTNGDCW